MAQVHQSECKLGWRAGKDITTACSLQGPPQTEPTVGPKQELVKEE